MIEEYSKRCLSSSKLLGCAILALFPDTLLVDCLVDPPYFAYRVVLKNPFYKTSLPLLQEKLKKLSKEITSWSIKEMLASNAASFLKSRGQSIRAKSLALKKGLVSIVEQDNFIDLVEEDTLLSLQGSSLDLLEVIEDNKERLFIGVCASSTQELKELKKAFKEAFKTSLYRKGERRGWFYLLEESNKVFKTPSYVRMQKQLLCHLENLLKKEGFSLFFTDKVSSDFYQDHKRLKLEKVAEFFTPSLYQREDFLNYLLPYPEGLSNINHIFNFSKEDSALSRSCLHLLTEIPRILHLDYYGVLEIPGHSPMLAIQESLDELNVKYHVQMGHMLSFKIFLKDALGRGWEIASITWKEALKTLSFSLFYSLEHVFLLWLSKEENNRILKIREQTLESK